MPTTSVRAKEINEESPHLMTTDESGPKVWLAAVQVDDACVTIWIEVRMDVAMYVPTLNRRDMVRHERSQLYTAKLCCFHRKH